ncbi:PhoPQ-activated pathogenicity protein [Planctomycetales bacterium]|nr:PhoPQ-activated pathogenicity protein [Planctomycetales bacterium]
MKLTPFISSAIIAIVLFSCSLVAAQTSGKISPVLDQYLKAPDDSYGWQFVEKLQSPLPGTKLSLLELTSQKWHDIIWKHYMIVAVPTNITFFDHALLYVNLGNTGSKPTKLSDFALAASMAAGAQMPIVILYQVPNQPLDIRNTGTGWREDDLIAESLLKTFETKDPTWAILLPMVKSVIKAMDASQEYLKKEYQLDVDSFIVGGASKRGWTTWLTGASKDPRVAGLVPIIYNNLNLGEQMNYQNESWGDFSPRINEYTSRKLFVKGETPTEEKEAVMKIIDPYAYLPRITQPKLLIHGANDPYWTVDATKLYWNDVVGTKFLLTVPNVGHQSMDKPENLMKVLPTVGVFCQYIASGSDWPQLEWDLKEKDKEYQVSIFTEIPDTKKVLWTATADDNHFEEAKWESKDVGTGDVVSIPKVSKGHIAFFIELQAIQEGTRFSLTTEVWKF